MANVASPFSTYSDTTPQKRVITDYISLIDPSDAPLVEALGGLDGAASKFKFVNKGTKVEWLEDTLTPLHGALTASAASNGTSLTVADGNVFQPGHIILIGTEQMWVSAVSGNTLTVTRDFGGVQATTALASTAAVEIIGMARVEGADSDPIGFTDRYTGSNYTQIFHKEVKVTETQQVIDQWGISNEFDYQAKKVVPELMRLIEKQLVYGKAGAGSASTPRSMAGFQEFISTANWVSSIAQTSFEGAVMKAYEAGGDGPWLAACSPTNLQTIKNFYDNSNFLTVTRDESKVGMVIETIVTPFGNVDLLLDRWMINKRLPIIDPKNAGFLTLRPFTQEPLAKTGDAVKGEVVGEFTFAMRQGKSHAMLTTA